MLERVGRSRTGGAGPRAAAARTGLLQRRCACGRPLGPTGECEQCRRRRLAGQEPATRAEAGSPAPASVHQVLRSPGRPLDGGLRPVMERRLGHDFGRVRVHTDPRAAESAREVGAAAYTVGPHLAFGEGRYSPGSAAGRHLLAHELAHVVQQGGSAPPGPTLRIAPAGGSAESEAERAAGAAAAGLAADSPSAAGSGLQRRLLEEEDPIHAPLIEAYRESAGLPPGGVDEFGRRVGPSPAQIKYGGGLRLPLCPDVESLEGRPVDFKDPEYKKAFRDSSCISDESRAAPPVCRFSSQQRKLLDKAQQTAASRSQRASKLMSTKKGRKLAVDLAGQLFSSDPPSVGTMRKRLAKVIGFLEGSGVRYEGRTCGDSECADGKTVAYVEGKGTLPIHICPLAFAHPGDIHRTVLHEALHWSGLDADPATPEGYCSKFDCKTPCLSGRDADAWSHYVDCLGKPFETRKDFREKIEKSVEDLP